MQIRDGNSKKVLKGNIRDKHCNRNEEHLISKQDMAEEIISYFENMKNFPQWKTKTKKIFKNITISKDYGTTTKCVTYT